MSELSEKDILKDPHKFGFCTFEEFKKNPDKWRTTMSLEQQLAAIDNGGQNLRGMIKERSFHVGLHKFNSLEKAEAFCREHGFDMTGWKALWEPTAGQWAHEKVILMSPEDFEKRSKW